MAIVKAQLNNFRLSPRKVRLIVDIIRGKDALHAIDQLNFINRRPSDIIIKLIRSAIANAENSFNMVASNLYIKDIYVDEGVKLKRYRPKAFGRSGEIQKKTSHIRLVLEERKAGLKAEKKAEKTVKHEHTHEHTQKEKEAIKPLTTKPEIKTELGKKAEKTKGIRRFFQRKSV